MITRHYGRIVAWRYPAGFKGLFSGFISNFAVNDRVADVNLEVKIAQDEIAPSEFYAIQRNKALFKTIPDQTAFISVLSYWLRWLFAPEVSDRLVLHASAAVWHGRALVMIGPPGSGKSTLVRHLCREGAAFLGEDAVELNMDNGLLEPCLPMSFIPDKLSQAVEPGAFVILDYHPETPGQLQFLRGHQAASLLLRDIYNLKSTGQRGLATVARLVNRGLFLVRYPELEQGIVMLREVLLDSGSASPV